MPRQFFIRFLLPQLTLIAIPCLVAAMLAWLQQSHLMLFWMLFLAVFAGLLSILHAIHFFKSYVNETASMLTDAVPAAKPKHANFDALKDVARSFGELMEDAA